MEYYLVYTFAWVLPFFINKIKKLYFYFIYGLMGGFVATRDLSLGTDTNTYLGMYEYISNAAFSFDYMDYGVEIGTRILIYISDFFNLGIYGFFFISAFITFFCLGSFVYRNTGRYYSIATVLLIAIEFWFFSFTGMRQALAISIFCYGYYYLVNERFVYALSFILLASLFHASALFYGGVLLIVVVVDYFIDKQYLPGFVILLTGGCFFLLLFFKDFLPLVVGEKYQHYFLLSSIYSAAIKSEGVVHYFKMIAYVIIMAIEYNYIRANKLKSYVNILLMMFAFTFLIYQHVWMVIFNRLTVMFEIFVVVSVPHILENVRNKYFEILVELMILLYGYLTIMNVLSKNYHGIY